MAQKRMRILVLIAIAAALLILTYTAVRVLRDPDAGNPPKDAAVDNLKARVIPKASVVPHLVVSGVKGKAERRGSSSAVWVPVQPSDELFADDRLRTGKDAAVHLEVDEKSRIELAGRSEVSVEELTETVHQIDLVLGRISVDYEASENRLLKIIAFDEDNAVAETSAARFVIQRANGEVTVATTMGTVKLTAKAESVIVGPKTYSSVSQGKAPRKPEPIPMEVLLKVANLKKSGPKERAAVISGKTNVGAVVHVNDEWAEVDDSGGFRVKVPLRSGQSQVDVVSNTAWGSAEKHVPIITVSDTAEVTGAKVRWGKSSRTQKPKGKGSN